MRAAAGVGLFVTLSMVWACDERDSAPAVDAPESHCVVMDAGCSPREDACCRVEGFVVTNSACFEPRLQLLACVAKSNGGGCAMGGLSSCYVKESTGEIFRLSATPSGPVPGLRLCDDGERESADKAQACP